MTMFARPATGWHHIAVKTQTAVPATGLNIGEANNDYLSGQIDDVKIYNKARTAEQVRRDYDSGPPPVARWKMDEKTGQYANDVLGNANTGTLGLGVTADASDPTWKSSASCHSGSCLKFDGTDDYVDAGAGSSLDIIGNFTATLWVKYNGSADNTNALRIFNKGNNSPSLYYIPSSQRIGFGDEAGYIYGVHNLSGSWHHITAIKTGNTINDITIYVDEVSLGTLTQTGTWDGWLSNSVHFFIGATSVLTVNKYWTGFIDDVRIYNYALTAQQVKTEFNQNSAVRFGPTEGLP